MLIDTHAHLSFKQFDDDRAAGIEGAEKAGVTRVVDVGTNLEVSRQAIALAEADPRVLATAGFHPHDAEKATDAALAMLPDLLSHERVVAVGETGLDFFRDYAPRDLQERVFRHHIHLARDTGLPLVVHSRGAEDEVLDMLEVEGGGEVDAVLHCFGGTAEASSRAVAMGFFLGFGGTVTYPKSTSVGVARSIPGDRLLLETDCPYLAPQAVRGKRNEPSHVQLVAEFLADQLGESLDIFSRRVTVNAERFYKLAPG